MTDVTDDFESGVADWSLSNAGGTIVQESTWIHGGSYGATFSPGIGGAQRGRPLGGSAAYTDNPTGEIWFQKYSTGTGGAVGIFLLDSATGDGYGVNLDFTYPKILLVRMDGFTQTSLGFTSTSLSLNTTYRLKFLLDYGGVGLHRGELYDSSGGLVAQFTMGTADTTHHTSIDSIWGNGPDWRADDMLATNITVSGTTVISTHAIPSLISSSVGAAQALPLIWASEIRAQSAQDLTTQWLQALASGQLVPNAYSGQVSSEQLAPAMAQLSVRSPQGLDALFGAAIGATFVLPARWGGAIGVTSAQELRTLIRSHIESARGSSAVIMAQLDIAQAVPVQIGADIGATGQPMPGLWASAIELGHPLEFAWSADIVAQLPIVAHWGQPAPGFDSSNLNIWHVDGRGTIWKISARGTVWHIEPR